MEKKCTYRLMSATNLIIAICLIVYVLDKYIVTATVGMFENPGIVEYILGFCGGDVYFSLCYFPEFIANGEYWRYITFLFPHLFILHLAVNMIALYIVGNEVEKKTGKIFVVIYFFVIGIVDLLISNGLPFLNTENSVTGGASGSVFGFVGFLAVLYFTDKAYKKTFSRGKKIFFIIYGIVFTYCMGDWTMYCHNIGFALGVLFGFFFIFFRKKNSRVTMGE